MKTSFPKKKNPSLHFLKIFILYVNNQACLHQCSDKRQRRSRRRRGEGFPASGASTVLRRGCLLRRAPRRGRSQGAHPSESIWFLYRLPIFAGFCLGLCWSSRLERSYLFCAHAHGFVSSRSSVFQLSVASSFVSIFLFLKFCCLSNFPLDYLYFLVLKGLQTKYMLLF